MQALIVVFYAEVAELVDALASGASGGNPVKVQVLSSAPTTISPVLHLSHIIYYYQSVKACFLVFHLTLS